jgi:integrative and conjugative element protein (TIGR02256 family)
MAVVQGEYTAASDGLETGGILLGHVREDSAIVSRAGGPGPNALRERDFFLRDQEHAQKLADAAFAVDGSMWIGEWHSHVGAPPVPSPRDLNTYAELLADDELAFDVVISLIIGASAAGSVLTAWGCERGHVQELPIFLADIDPR